MAASHKFQTLAAQGEFLLAEPAALVQLDGQAETAARTEWTF